MEGEIERLRAENKQLREQSEDLQAQLLHDSVERGQSLLADRLPSLAEELNGKDSTEVNMFSFLDPRTKNVTYFGLSEISRYNGILVAIFINI